MGGAVRVGNVLRAVRIRRGQRQRDVADAAHVSRATISRIERGHLGSLSVDALERVAAAMEVKLDLIARWRGGELDRLVNAGHSAMHERLARSFQRKPGWLAVPEVSFSIYGERGVVDILAWHETTRTTLVIELKTAIVDVQDLVASIGRKRRLATRIAAERGWGSDEVGCWVVIAGTMTNRRRVGEHAAMLRAAFPDSGQALRAWLRLPVGSIAALSFVSNAHPGNARGSIATRQRICRRAVRSNRA
jgi:transcriptional regulator with XRE-family HTH domain